MAIFFLGLRVLGPSHPVVVPLTPREQSVKSDLLRLVGQEDEAIVNHNHAELSSVFSLPAANRALRHAQARQAFLDAWSKGRGLTIQSVQVSLRTPGITFTSPNRVQVFAVVSERYRYQYHQRPTENQFGLGIRHDYVLARHLGHWRIAQDEFTDPLDQDTRISGSSANPAASSQLYGPPPNMRLSSGAHKAIAYADQYCGAAPGCQQAGQYNTRYNNFNGEGGDCTNFVSQALLAGGFRETPEWNYDRTTGDGSRAWSNARGLFDFLESSGRATIFAQGRFLTMTRPTTRFPHGPIAAIRPGDLISYVERGRAVHTAIVVGFDSQGVPVVDSHTSDRYHVPWDLGWDYRTYYYLWHVHYPPTQAPEPVLHGRSPRIPGYRGATNPPHSVEADHGTRRPVKNAPSRH